MPDFYEGDFSQEADENSFFVRLPNELNEQSEFWVPIREKARREGIDFGFGEVEGKMRKHTRDRDEVWKVPRMKVALIKGGSSAPGFMSFLKGEMSRQVKLLR